MYESNKKFNQRNQAFFDRVGRLSIGMEKTAVEQMLGVNPYGTIAFIDNAPLRPYRGSDKEGQVAYISSSREAYVYIHYDRKNRVIHIQEGNFFH